jgi:DNA-directed RNA polymerase specialized sigma24 family protein
VTNREKIDYLKQYKNLDKYINHLLEECERLRTRAEKVTPTLTGMPTGGDGENQRELAICKLVDLNNEINEKIDQYVDLGCDIQATIDGIGDIHFRQLLTYRYIDGMTFEEIAVCMNYSWKQIHRLHSQALNKIMS